MKDKRWIKGWYKIEYNFDSENPILKKIKDKPKWLSVFLKQILNKIAQLDFKIKVKKISDGVYENLVSFPKYSSKEFLSNCPFIYKIERELRRELGISLKTPKSHPIRSQLDQKAGTAIVEFEETPGVSLNEMGFDKKGRPITTRFEGLFFMQYLMEDRIKEAIRDMQLEEKFFVENVFDMVSRLEKEKVGSFNVKWLNSVNRIIDRELKKAGKTREDFIKE